MTDTAAAAPDAARRDIEAAMAGYVFDVHELVPVVDWSRIPRRLRLRAQRARGGRRDAGRLPVALLVALLVVATLPGGGERGLLLVAAVAAAAFVGLRGSWRPRRWAQRVVRRYAGVEYLDASRCPELAASVLVAYDLAGQRRQQRPPAQTARPSGWDLVAAVERTVLGARGLPATQQAPVVDNLVEALAQAHHDLGKSRRVALEQRQARSPLMHLFPRPGRSR